MDAKPVRRPNRTRPLADIQQDEADAKAAEDARKEIAEHGTVPWEQIKREQGL